VVGGRDSDGKRRTSCNEINALGGARSSLLQPADYVARQGDAREEGRKVMNQINSHETDRCLVQAKNASNPKKK
jgi:hypothetical protein